MCRSLPEDGYELAAIFIVGAELFRKVFIPGLRCAARGPGPHMRLAILSTYLLHIENP